MTQPHTIDRRRYPAGTNAAGQTDARCLACGRTFDVGAVRATHPTFRPYCTPECFQTSHAPDRVDAITTRCRCGWFTSTTAAARRFPAHVRRCEGAAAA